MHLTTFINKSKDIIKIYRHFNNKTTTKIISLLNDSQNDKGYMAVSEIADEVEMHQSHVSGKLAELKEIGLVNSIDDATDLRFQYYRLNKRKLFELKELSKAIVDLTERK